MYFDPSPKTKKEDLFDREKELKELISSDSPLTMVLGVRRIGKTSLLHVFKNDSDFPAIFIDTREFSSVNASIEDLAMTLSKSLEELSSRYRHLIKMLKKLKGIKISGVEVRIEPEGLKRSIVDIFRELNEWGEREGKKVYVIFDEAQNLRFFRRGHGITFNEIFGYIYDNLKNIRVILTGSEIGLLEEFVGLEDPASSLYGRYIKEIILKPFDEEKSLQFLMEGFKQAGMRPNRDVLENAVNRLDGIVGWLVFFGKTCIDSGRIDEESIDETLKIASKVVEAEIRSLSKHSKRYIHALKVIAQGAKSWKEIKEGMEFLEKKRLTDTAVMRILEKLEKMTFVEKTLSKDGKKQYKIVDPIVEYSVTSIL